jgi:hypothetical protein
MEGEGMASTQFFNAWRTVGLVVLGHAVVLGFATGAQAQDAFSDTYHAPWPGDQASDPATSDIYQSISDSTSSLDEFAGSECNSCGGGCQSQCGGSCGSCCGCDDKLLGIIAKSDTCFDDFISPLSNICFFEDPRTVTEARLIFLNNRVPGNAPVLGNSDVQLYAMQIRAALTKRLSIIANKDGYINMDSDLYGHEEGWTDVAAGLKYNVIRDPGSQTVVSVGGTYEIDLGSHRVFQGRGDGEFRFFLTGGKEIADDWHWLSESGFRIPTDHTARSQLWYWSNHIDHEVCSGWYALLELNWFHWMRSGDGDLGTSGFEGNDLFNLGSADVAGNDIVTTAIGGRWKPYSNVEVGFGWEVPLTNRRDLLHDRVYADLIVRY